MTEQHDRTPGLVSHSGGRMSEEELLARGERREATPVDDDESVTTSAGLPPRGSAELEDPRYAEITVISSTGGFPS